MWLQALEALHGAAVAVWHLQRVLAKKRDPLSHVLFSDVLQTASCPSPLAHFWCGLQNPLLVPHATCSRAWVPRPPKRRVRVGQMDPAWMCSARY